MVQNQSHTHTTLHVGDLPGNEEKVLIKVFINHFAKQEIESIGLASPNCILIPYPNVIRDWYGDSRRPTSTHTNTRTHKHTHTYPSTFQLLQRVLLITTHLSNKHSRPNVPVFNYHEGKKRGYFVGTFQ